jgi:hypothetical protein
VIPKDMRRFEVACDFQVRTPAGDGKFYFDDIAVKGQYGEHWLYTPHPPLVGDLIWLANEGKDHGRNYRVIDRQWSHSQYGSVNWPLTESRPQAAPMLTVLVEPAEGMFVNQVLREGEVDDET